MHLSKFPSIKLVSMLPEYVSENNRELVREIYKIISERNDFNSLFWRATYANQPDWVIRIVAEIRRPLKYDEIAVIESPELFKELVSCYGLDGVENIIT